MSLLKEYSRPLKHHEGDVKLMIHLYIEGFSARQIGRLFECSSDTVIKRLKDAGVQRRPQLQTRRREQHPNWKGGRRLDGKYVVVMLEDDSPFASMRTNRREVKEHRLLMAKAVGRPLTESESVHHINGNTFDNRLENLQLRSRYHGDGQVRLCGDCGSHNIICAGL